MNRTFTMNDVQSAFETALTLPPTERHQWLHEQYGPRRELVAEVQSLLRFSSLSDDPLERGFHVTSTVVREIDHASAQEDVPEVTGYSNLAKLAEGGQSIVYRGTQSSTGQQVAIKILKSRDLGTASRQRLHREARLLAELRHPNIVPIIDQPVTRDGAPCLVTRLMDGKPVDEFFDALVGDRWQILASVMGRICSAVDVAHRGGVVHRDLKPSNILVDDNNEPCLLDFGLSSSNLSGGRLTLPGATQEGDFVGSVAWASPEQIDSSLGPISPQTDIYQLAVIAYQLLSGGRFPYSVDDGFCQTFQRIVRNPPAPLVNRELGEDRQQRLNGVFVRALQKVPSRRFGSALEFGEALTNAMCPSEPKRRSNDQTTTRTCRRSLWLAGLCVSPVIGLFVLSSPGSDPPPAADQTSYSSTVTPDNANVVPPILDIDFRNQRAPHLPAGWTGDPGIRIARDQLTISQGTRIPAVARSNDLSVSGDWMLTIEHEIQGNGRFDLTLVSENEQTCKLAIHRGRIESVQGQRGSTSVVGRRCLVIEKDGDRCIVRLQGAPPLHFDLRRFASLLQLQFALRNAGSGGGSVGIHRVALQTTTTGE